MISGGLSISFEVEFEKQRWKTEDSVPQNFVVTGRRTEL